MSAPLHNESIANELVAYSQSISALESGKALQITAEEVGGIVVASLAYPEVIEREIARSPESEGWRLLNAATEPREVEAAARLLAEIQLAKEALRHARSAGTADYSTQLQRHESEYFEHFDDTLFQLALGYKIREVESLDVGMVYGADEAKALVLDTLSCHVDNTVLTEQMMEASQPRQETMDAVQGWLEDQFGDSVSMIDEMAAVKDGEPFDHNEIRDVFQAAIDTTPYLRENGWRVEVVEREKSAISVYSNERLIVVPVGRTASAAKLKKLDIHEAFGHALRSAEAEHNGDVEGTTGTPTYSRFEESFEIVLEQCLDGVYNETQGVNHYLAIGLAIGASDKEPLSKDDIYFMFKSIAQLKSIAKSQQQLTQKQAAASMSTAITQYKRTFAGMANTADGTAHLKDINYLSGRIGAWRLLEAIVEADELDEGMRWLLSAKMNPFVDKDRVHVQNAPPMPNSIREIVNR